MSPEILVTTRINPDLDGLACAYAYSRFLKKQGKTAAEAIFGQPHVEAQYLIDRFKIHDINYSPKGHFDKFILVDASDIKGMPEVVRTEDVIEVIDHREFYAPTQTFPNAKIQIELVGAAATLIAEKYQRRGTPIDYNSAILLYGAIHSNSLNLKAKITTTRDKKILAWLKNQTQIPENLIHEMFLAKTKAARKNLAHVLKDDFKDFTFNQTHVGIAQLEIVELEELVKNNLTQILSVLEELKKEHGLNFAFLTAVDLEKGFNLFVTANPNAQSLLEKIFRVGFQNNVAKREGLILRKEIVSLITKSV